MKYRFLTFAVVIGLAAVPSAAWAQDDGTYGEMQAQGMQEMSQWGIAGTGQYTGTSIDQSRSGLSDSSREFMRQSYIRAGRELPPYLQNPEDSDRASVRRRRAAEEEKYEGKKVRYRMMQGDGKTLYGMPLPKRVFNNVPEGR